MTHTSLMAEAALRRAVSCLDERDAALYTAYVHGDNLTELAERLGFKSEGAVRLRLNRLGWYISEAFPGDEDIRELVTHARHR